MGTTIFSISLNSLSSSPYTNISLEKTVSASSTSFASIPKLVSSAVLYKERHSDAAYSI